MISNRCARKSLVTNCNSIISKNYLRLLVDSNESYNKKNAILINNKDDTTNIFIKEGELQTTLHNVSSASGYKDLYWSHARLYRVSYGFHDL